EAEAALRDMLDKLACALVGQVNMLNPQCVVVCNEGAFLRDDHLAYLERRVNQGKLSKHHVRPVRVLRSAFGERSALFGSAGVVLDRLFRT
ncbi:MAG: ROK family protein, partial [Clostridiales bacterium]|nr:ROK family protein [Clostridiales bacterium]